MNVKIYIDRLKMSLKRHGLYKTLLSSLKKFSVIYRDLSQYKINKICYDIISRHARILPWHYSFSSVDVSSMA